MFVPHHARPALVGAATSTALVILMTGSSLAYHDRPRMGCDTAGCTSLPSAPGVAPTAPPAQPATPVTMPVTPPTAHTSEPQARP